MTPRKPPSEEQLREAFSEVGDALQRAVVLSSDRVQSVFEDAVVRGRMTRRDAEELASSLVALGRDQALELRSEVDTLARSLPSRVAEAAGAVSPRTREKLRSKRKDDESAPDDAVQAEVTRLVEGNGRTGLPADAASMTAKELIALTGTLAPPGLRALRAEEEAGKARATVLRAIDAKLQG